MGINVIETYTKEDLGRVWLDLELHWIDPSGERGAMDNKTTLTNMWFFWSWYTHKAWVKIIRIPLMPLKIGRSSLL